MLARPLLESRLAFRLLLSWSEAIHPGTELLEMGSRAERESGQEVQATAVEVTVALELDDGHGSGSQRIGGAAQLSELGDGELGCWDGVGCVCGFHDIGLVDRCGACRPDVDDVGQRLVGAAVEAGCTPRVDRCGRVVVGCPAAPEVIKVR